MAQSWFGKLSLLVPTWPRGFKRRFSSEHNLSTAAVVEPAKSRQTKHGFCLPKNAAQLSIFLILVLATFHQIFWPLRALPKAENTPTRIPEANSQATRSLPALDDYLAMARKRELFKPSVPLPAEKKLGQTTAEELAKRFKFLGISGSGSDLLALVAVANAGVQTVKQGERLEDFLIKEISPGKLILELNEDIVVLKR